MVAQRLRLAAAPAFAVMALLTGILDDGAPVALCAAGGFGLRGMAPMYLVMAAIHLGSWLRLISRPADVTLFVRLDRSSYIQKMEQKP